MLTRSSFLVFRRSLTFARRGMAFSTSSLRSSQLKYEEQGEKQYKNSSNSSKSNFGKYGALSFFFISSAAAAATWDVDGTAPGYVAQVEANLPAIREAIVKVMEDENEEHPYDLSGSYGPIFVRLAWHASGTYDKDSKTGGSNGATMRFKEEAGHGANNGLVVARNRLEPVKKQFPFLSYADLWTLAGAVAVEEMGGPTIRWRPGRSDYSPKQYYVVPEGRLPDAAQGADHVRDIFYRMGFNDREITALIGAHSLGRCHRDRSGFEGPWTRSPTTFSNDFYNLLLNEKWTWKKWDGPAQYKNEKDDLMMLPADMAFLLDPAFQKIVKEYAQNESVFFDDYAKAFSKLMELGVPFEKK